MTPVTISEGRATDLEEVLALLASVDLRGEGLAKQIDGFLVVREDGQLVATAGLEDHGLAGILRSVAVASGYRGRGIAATLVRAIIGRSRAKGHEALYLLTNAAGPYFERFGFQRVERVHVRPAVLASGQFVERACAQSTVMVLEYNRSGRVEMSEHLIRNAVRERYARAATAGTPCCDGPKHSDADASCATASCCTPTAIAFSDGRAVPDEIAGMSLGCGAPIEAAAPQPGETVVDLGSGAGLDAFLAADQVGAAG